MRQGKTQYEQKRDDESVALSLGNHMKDILRGLNISLN
jgi:hypothetical protein